MLSSARCLLAFTGVFLTTFAAPASAAIDHAQAASIFQQAKEICTRDNGTLWGRTLCGPMLLVDPDDLSVVTNQADAQGLLKPSGSVFVGTLPSSQPLSDTTITWLGTRWCELLWPWPMREDTDMRHVTLAHELFHRIEEDDLHIQKLDGDNAQLDTLEGRYLMEMEWRALSAALNATAADAGRQASADAILFRRERYRLFPKAAANEAALESNEGISEYTGVKLGLMTPGERVRYAIRDLQAFVQAPSLVRSFAYATGPAYGLLLDSASSTWLHDFAAHPLAASFDQRLSTALHLPMPDFAHLHEREAAYDADGSLRTHEVTRDHDKKAQLLHFQTALIDGNVLILPLKHANFQFQPQSLVPLAGVGTVYPTMQIQDDWGTLIATSGGVLVRKQPEVAVVSAAGLDVGTLHGQGFVLTLKPGWKVDAGERAGDLLLTRNTK